MSLPRYAEYKDSGVDWLGEVPEHWESWKLSHAFGAIGSGTTPSSDEVVWYADGTVPWVTTGELRETFVSETAKNVTDAAIRKFPALRIHPAGSLAIAMYGATIGRLGILAVDATTNQACCVLSQPRNLDVRFLFHWLLGFKQKLIDLYATGGGQPNISKEAISSLRVFAPCLTEQSAIAAFLDRETGKIDAMIAEQEKLLTLLAEKRQATISHAVTRGLNPNAPMKDSGVPWLGEVPAHWAITRLKFVAVVQTGIAKGKDTQGKETIAVPYLRVANVQDGHLALDEVAMIDIEPEQLDRYRLQAGDVLMNEGGDFDKLGRGAIWNAEIEDCIHQNHVFAVRPHAVSPQWLNQITGSQYAQFYFMRRSKQSTNLASISSTNIMELPVLLPPADEQASILSFVDNESARLDALHASSVQAIALLKERRSALIAAAVTGKIDVRSEV